MKLAVISGAIANKPFNGGEAWVRLSWVLGLKRLGYKVVFVEQLNTDQGANEGCTEENGQLARVIDYFRQTLSQFELHRSAALVDGNGDVLWGINTAELQSISRTASLLINISGHLTWPSFKKAIPIRVYVDLDPGFTQFWQVQGTLGDQLDGHTHYFTVGENIGTADCSIPAGGIEWRAVRQPVVLDDWPVAAADSAWRFTTIASWRGSYGPVQVGDKTYGLKVHEFRKFIHLPRLVDREFEIALDIHPAEERDIQLLRENKWQLVDPKRVAGDLLQYRRYVQNSGAEFSVAQGIYVDTHCGWFSDRTVRYLASGKPALVQDTGFSQHLPVGDGLLAFRTLDEAVAGAREIIANYDRHSRAARKLAEDYFDSGKVLAAMLTEIGADCDQ
jgi:hypothetical protein